MPVLITWLMKPDVPDVEIEARAAARIDLQFLQTQARFGRGIVIIERAIDRNAVVFEAAVVGVLTANKGRLHPAHLTDATSTPGTDAMAEYAL